MADKNTKVIIPNYPSNSTGKKDSKDDDVRVIEKVISGTATVRRRNPWTKFAEGFFNEDLSYVKDSFVNDMLVPGIKEGILSIMEMLFFGTARGRRTNYSGGSKRNVDRASYMINYGSYSSNRSRSRERDDRDLDSRYSVTMDDIEFDSRSEAEKVLDALREDIVHYNEATLSAYYQYAGVSSNDYTAGDRGWTNLDMNIRPRRVRGGRYVLDLPRPHQLV